MSSEVTEKIATPPTVPDDDTDHEMTARALIVLSGSFEDAFAQLESIRAQIRALADRHGVEIQIAVS